MMTDKTYQVLHFIYYRYQSISRHFFYAGFFISGTTFPGKSEDVKNAK